jgi:hypothetical protein
MSGPAAGTSAHTASHAAPRPLGHHLFTSFGGQRTVHCSPWLIDRLPMLEDRAQAAYHHPGSWEAVHTAGHWLFTSVAANGVDHVGRPRQLVHQVALQDAHVPPVFSPLWLRRAVLPRLDSGDPAAVSARLAGDLAALDLRTLMPDPAGFAALLRSPVRVAAGAMLHALSRPGVLVDQPLRGLAAAFDQVAAVLAAALIHQPACRIVHGEGSLPATGPALSTLRLADYDPARGMSGETMFMDGGHYPSDWLLDTIADAAQPPRMLFLLRRVPLASLLAKGARERLGPALAGLAPTLGRDGTPALAADHPQAGAWLSALAEAGAAQVATTVLGMQRDQLRADGRLNAVRDALTTVAILSPTPAAVLAAASA